VNRDGKNFRIKTRRSFLGSLLRLSGVVMLLVSPVTVFINRAYAQAKRLILPKGTKMSSLVEKNPADLDTRHLEVIPLERFETMGMTDHETDIAAWRLKITGKVQKPLDLTYNQIMKLPSIERNVLLICPGFFTNHGKWKGISVAELLKLARVESGITHISFQGPPGRYEKTESFPVADVLSDKIFLAYQVNGQRLPRKHGFPLRAVAEDHYGSVWVKYVHKVEAYRVEG
jgi:DMSO/TMAO reductase YedYZ molybdopterin-dependent catalytic subunit